jgi:hypothetical protein
MTMFPNITTGTFPYKAPQNLKNHYYEQARDEDRCQQMVRSVVLQRSQLVIEVLGNRLETDG